MRKHIGLASMAALLLPATMAFSAEEIQFAPPDPMSPQQGFSLPYAFFNQTFGAAVGYVKAKTGWEGQRQAALMGTVIAGSSGSAMAFVMGRDILMPGTERLFMDPIASIGFFDGNRTYISGNDDFPDERAGSHNSDDENYVEGHGLDAFVRYKFKYLLPMGHGKAQAIPNYQLKDGQLVSGATGGESWNPFTSGRTFLELRPFYRSQEVNAHEDGVHSTSKTNGLDLSLFWDNRDYPLNPSKGNGARMRVSRDFGQFDSNNSWTVMEGEFDYYHPFGSSDRFSQRVLALDAWTAYSPTWEVNDDGTISNGPPQYQGATLGGLWKMRGYSANRFSDKAALYFAAEYRLTAQKNPFDRWPKIVDMLGIKWAQYTVFAEAGRVAPNSQLDTLTDDMNWDIGGGIRVMASGMIARIDIAVSEEEVGVQMMVAHPFQF